MNGRKRHILVDTMGFVVRVVVHPANIADTVGAKRVLTGRHARFPDLTQIWADQGYHQGLVSWLATSEQCSLSPVARPRKRHWTRVDAEGSSLPRTSDPAPASPGFVIQPRRWVVERTFAWLGRNRRLSKDYEGLPSTEEAWIALAMSRILWQRLAA